MGRSVWTHENAVVTVFYQLDDDGDEFSCDLWDCHVDDIQEAFKRKFPSMVDCDYWPERESHAIVENERCMVVISEYCGLISLGIVPLDDDGLAIYWTREHVAPFLRETYGELRKIGTMSNGEAVYERA